MLGNVTDYEQLYRRKLPIYERLLEEVHFILTCAVADAKIKVHSQGGRVKELPSALEKIRRKQYTDPESQLEDIVGYRIVCLFSSDLARLKKIIDEKFAVVRSEDKIDGEGDPATFGYMSDHHICNISADCAGPRYEGIHGIIFEIQCRTILMDAWANVSHYLAYKGNASIPSHLRRDFYALSGLFYVADRHFELFFGEAMASAQEAISRAASGDIDDDAVNLETVQALFRQMYPDLHHASAASISEFVEEIVPLGYTSIRHLRRTLETVDAIARKENAKKVSNDKFLDIGMARTGLRKAHRQYDELLLIKTRARHRQAGIRQAASKMSTESASSGAHRRD